MSNDHSMAEKDAANDANSNRVWPGKLNVALISIGVLAFGLIIVDRLVSMVGVDDLPDTAEIERAVETEVASGVETESGNTLSDSTLPSAPTAAATSAATTDARDSGADNRCDNGVDNRCDFSRDCRRRRGDESVTGSAHGGVRQQRFGIARFSTTN